MERKRQGVTSALKYRNRNNLEIEEEGKAEAKVVEKNITKKGQMAGRKGRDITEQTVIGYGN